MIDLLVEPVQFFGIVDRYDLRPADRDPFEKLRPHDRTQTAATQEGFLPGLDVGVADQPFTGLSDGDALELAPFGFLHGVFRLVGIFPPEMGGILDFHLVVVHYDINRFFSTPVNDDGIVARFLDFDAEAGRGRRVRIQVEGRRDGAGASTWRPLSV